MRSHFVQRKGALDYKAMGFYLMSPDDFINLTTGFKEKASVEESAKSLDFYNQKVEEGEILTHPFIDVDPNGKVKRHEGRHRAQAVKEAGGTEFLVAIYPDRKHRMYKESDLPETLTGQFTGFKLPIDASKFEWIEFNREDGEKY